LWIDALPALHALCPEVDAACAKQVVSGVTVLRWSGDADFGAPAGIVVEAFGCGLPESYVESMVDRRPSPVWIILEYLSAEPWVASHHGLPSPHPGLGLERHFFFPGIGPGTGGVLREASLEEKRAAFEASPGAQSRFWQGLGFTPTGAKNVVVSLFGYENPAVAALMQTWAAGKERAVVAVPRSNLRAQVCDFFGSADPGDGATLERGSLEVRFLPFLPQPAYDELLWACDWNFVRGEDSFVRAQWAQRPLLWHIYPQREQAHRVKLDAFLDAYCTALEPPLAAALRSLAHLWNGPGAPQAGQMQAAWEILIGGRLQMRRHAQAWAGRLALPGDLAGNLAQYCEERLK
jgi:uncharacterized repeat protein (TIGR03837 family)